MQNNFTAGVSEVIQLFILYKDMFTSMLVGFVKGSKQKENEMYKHSLFYKKTP